MKIYRNIFFHTSIIQKGHGTVDVNYYGKLYANATHLKDFKKLYDDTKDLYIVCGSCASKKYRNFIKVNNKLS